jgi:hypothetical protein
MTLNEAAQTIDLIFQPGKTSKAAQKGNSLLTLLLLVHHISHVNRCIDLSYYSYKMKSV